MITHPQRQVVSPPPSTFEEPSSDCCADVRYGVRGSHHVVTEEDERAPADHLPVDHGQTPLGLLVLALPGGVGAQQLGAGQAVAPGDRRGQGGGGLAVRGLP